MAAYPASDPLVLAVGGTEGFPGPDGLWTNGGYGGEQVWNEISRSGSRARPAAHRASSSTRRRGSARCTRRIASSPTSRTTRRRTAACSSRRLRAERGRRRHDDRPDALQPVAPPHIAVGGTSAGTPQWAAIVALANQVRLQRKHGQPVGLVAPLLYDIGKDKKAYARDFHDITVGQNGLDLTRVRLPADAVRLRAAPGLRRPDRSRDAERRESARRSRQGRLRARSPADSAPAEGRRARQAPPFRSFPVRTASVGLDGSADRGHYPRAVRWHEEGTVRCVARRRRRTAGST